MKITVIYDDTPPDDTVRDDIFWINRGYELAERTSQRIFGEGLSVKDE